MTEQKRNKVGFYFDDCAMDIELVTTKNDRTFFVLNAAVKANQEGMTYDWRKKVSCMLRNKDIGAILSMLGNTGIEEYNIQQRTQAISSDVFVKNYDNGEKYLGMSFSGEDNDEIFVKLNYGDKELLRVFIEQNLLKAVI